MDTFRRLIDEKNWALGLPFYVRGIKLDEETLGERPLRVSAQDIEERLLLLQAPYMQGDDVRAVQQALVDAGFKITADGVFGPRTHEAVRKFQQQQGLMVDGIVGPATLSALGL